MGTSHDFAARKNGVAPKRFRLLRPSMSEFGSRVSRALMSAPCSTSFLASSMLLMLPLGFCPGLFCPRCGRLDHTT